MLLEQLLKSIRYHWNIYFSLVEVDKEVLYSNKPNRQLRLVTPLFLTATIT